MVSIRPMRGEDLPRVNAILAQAFSQEAAQRGMNRQEFPLCRPELLRMYLSAWPSGCFVATESSGAVVGFVFSRLWGSVGWFGPLAVMPAEEDRGHGKRLVTACVEALKSAGARTIGLETPAASARNLALYTKLGFVSECLSVDLLRDVSTSPGVRTEKPLELRWYSQSSEANRGALDRLLRALCEAIEPRLDYRGEAALIRRHGFGDACLVLEGGTPLGYLMAHTEPYTSEEARQFLKIYALLVHPDSGLPGLERLLAVAERWARQEALRYLTLRAQVWYREAFEHLLSEGFRIIQNDMRLTLRGFGQRPSGREIHFSRWQ